MGKTKINHPFGNGLYKLIMMIWGMVYYCFAMFYPHWLVVSTPLKNISQLGWLFPKYGKIKNVPNHHAFRESTYSGWGVRSMNDTLGIEDAGDDCSVPWNGVSALCFRKGQRLQVLSASEARLFKLLGQPQLRAGPASSTPLQWCCGHKTLDAVSFATAKRQSNGLMGVFP